MVAGPEQPSKAKLNGRPRCHAPANREQSSIRLRRQCHSIGNGKNRWGIDDDQIVFFTKSAEQSKGILERRTGSHRIFLSAARKKVKVKVGTGAELSDHF